MSSKSYSEQWRKNRKKRKRSNKHHRKHEHEQSRQNDVEDNDPLQSQDLLAADSDQEEGHVEQEPQENVQQEQAVQEEQEEPVNMNVIDCSIESKSESNNRQENAQEEPQVRDDASLSTVGSRVNPRETAQDERVKTLLSQALVDLTVSQEECATLQQALAASQEQCQQMQQALAQSQEKCDTYHKKYSALKSKFYKWYHHCLKEWAAKLYRGETRDLPPEIDGMSPQSTSRSSPQVEQEEDQSVGSALQPRRILQVAGNDGSSSVTPSPFVSRQEKPSDESVVQPKRLSTDLQKTMQHTKENIENESFAARDDYTKKQSPSADLFARDKADAARSKAQFDAPINTKGEEASANLGEKRKFNESAKDGESIHSEAIETRLDVPAKDDEANATACPEDEETQLDLVVSRNHRRRSLSTGSTDDGPLKSRSDTSSSQAWQDEETQLEGFAGHRRGKKSCLQEDDTSSSGAAHSRATESNRHETTMAARARPSPASSRLHDNTSATSDTLDRHEKREQCVESASSRSNASAANETQDSQVFEHESDDMSQALLSRLPATPPKVVRKPASTSKDRASSKNASVLRATQGWTSNVTARAFVGSMTKPPAKKKPRTSNNSIPAAASSGGAIKADSIPSKNVSEPAAKPNRPQPKPVRNPYVDSSKKPHNRPSASKPHSGTKRGTRTEWSDDDDDNAPKPYKFEEVVRCRHDRQQLPGHCCPECEKFMEALCPEESDQCFNRKEFLGMSRHRARHTPPSTPPGFWELSFADEKLAEENNDSLYF